MQRLKIAGLDYGTGRGLYPPFSFSIASAKVAPIAKGLLIHERFQQPLLARPVLGFEGSELSQPLPLPPHWGSPQSSIAGSNYQGDVSFFF